MSELVFIVLDLIPMLTCRLLHSQQELAQRGGSISAVGSRILLADRDAWFSASGIW